MDRILKYGLLSEQQGWSLGFRTTEAGVSAERFLHYLYATGNGGGGTVVGNAGAKQGYPAGTKIPPTKVDIIRPDDLLK